MASMALIGAAALGAGHAFAQLPTGIKAVPFYDQAKINFNGVKTIWMEEVPGRPRHFWVLCQDGLLYTLYPGGGDYVKSQIADFRAKVHFKPKSEYGAYTLAFHPGFITNGRFFLLYLAPPAVNAGAEKSGGTVKVEEWQATGAPANQVALKRTVLTFSHKPSYGASSMAFGPDGCLYLSLSDYGTDGWDLSTWGRKLLRIDIDRQDAGREYAIPADNPYAGHADPRVKKEIWASGLRNGWSFTWDPWTDELWLGDVGQTEWEELNIIKPGRNYGWGAGGDGETGPWTGFNGKCAASAHKDSCDLFEDPAYAFSYTGWAPQGSVSGMKCINAGRFFRGDKSSPFYGHLIFADESTDRVAALKKGAEPQIVGDVSEISHRGDHDGIAHIGEDSYGNLYAVFISWHATSYHIYRLDHPLLKPLATPTASLDREKRVQRAGAPELRISLDANDFPAPDARSRFFTLDGRTLATPAHRTPQEAGLYVIKL